MLQCPGLVLCPSCIPEEVCVNQTSYSHIEWVEIRNNHTSNCLFLYFTYTWIILPHIYSNAKTWFFFLKWALKFAYEVPNQIPLNQTTQTKACFTKLSCVNCTLLRYYANQGGNSLLIFQDKGQKERTQHECR